MLTSRKGSVHRLFCRTINYVSQPFQEVTRSTRGSSVYQGYAQRQQNRSASALTTTTPPNTSLASKSLLVDTLALVSCWGVHHASNAMNMHGPFRTVELECDRVIPVRPQLRWSNSRSWPSAVSVVRKDRSFERAVGSNDWHFDRTGNCQSGQNG